MQGTIEEMVEALNISAKEAALKGSAVVTE